MSTADTQAAVAACLAALRVYTREANPDNHRRAQEILGDSYMTGAQWIQAAAAYGQAIEAGSELFLSAFSEAGRRSESSRVSNLKAKRAFALARAGHFEDALLNLEEGKARFLAEQFDLATVFAAATGESRDRLQRLHSEITAIEAEMAAKTEPSEIRGRRERTNKLHELRTEMRKQINQLQAATVSAPSKVAGVQEVFGTVPEGGH
jgi:hypothetical protein